LQSFLQAAFFSARWFARINTLEREHSRKDQEIERLKARVKELRGTTPPEEKQEKWTDKIQLSGVLEVEYGVFGTTPRKGAFQNYAVFPR